MHLRLVAAVAVGAFLSTAAFAQTLYEICEFGDLSGPGDFTEGFGINDAGHIVGRRYEAETGTSHAFFWDRRNPLRDLGTLPGDMGSVAFSVNDHDVVTGQSYGDESHVFVWRKVTGMKPLQGPDDSVRPISPAAINNSGQIVGRTQDDGFTWDPVEGLRPLPPIIGLMYTFPSDINNNGRIVGNGFGNPASPTFLIDLRTLRQQLLPLSFVDSINDRGQVGGAITTPAGLRAAIWDRVKGVTRLGEFPGGEASSIARDMNNAGTIVGVSWTGEFDAPGRGFTWDKRNGLQVLTDLVDRPMDFLIPEAINNRGWIVANGRDLGTFDYRAVLLIPLSHRKHPRASHCESDDDVAEQ